MERYSVIKGDYPREILLLRGYGCRWRKCTFCDYHLDSSKNEEENFRINKEALNKVTGKFGTLEAINSGSFGEIDAKTMNLLADICREKQIHTVHFECHYQYRSEIPPLKEKFQNIGVKTRFRIGVETFDYNLRENILKKGVPIQNPAEIAKDFDECNLLVGIKGQTANSMKSDIEIGLSLFDRLYINVMTPNKAKIQGDKETITTFIESIYPLYKNHPQIDILLNNTDFGVGEI